MISLQPQLVSREEIFFKHFPGLILLNILPKFYLSKEKLGMKYSWWHQWKDQPTCFLKLISTRIFYLLQKSLVIAYFIRTKSFPTKVIILQHLQLSERGILCRSFSALLILQATFVSILLLNVFKVTWKKPGSSTIYTSWDFH